MNIRISILLIASSLLLLLAIGLSSSLPAPQKKPPARLNILLFIADDWGFPHAGIYGDKTARTPHFDSLARHGALFQNAFCAASSCSPSRAAILTGRYPHQLEAGANLWSYLPKKFPVYPDLLAKAGYRTGYTEKGWGPGGGWMPGWKSDPEGYASNPAGPHFTSFDEFLTTQPAGEPFCFWYGPKTPHRPYKKGIGLAAGYRPEQVTVPPYLADTPAVREDLLDYYQQVETLDMALGKALEALRKAGQLENTLIIVTSDNGHPFERAKTNEYDAGSRVPLLVYQPGRIKPSRWPQLINLLDLHATILDAAGLKPDARLPSRSWWPALTQDKPPKADAVFLEREAHYFADSKNLVIGQNRLSYPVRAIRTTEYLYIQNLRPDRWPGHIPETDEEAQVLENGKTAVPASPAYFRWLAFGKRPAEELYSVQKDPHQLRNLAMLPAYKGLKTRLRKRLMDWRTATADPRIINPADDSFDTYPIFRAN